MVADLPAAENVRNDPATTRPTPPWNHHHHHHHQTTGVQDTSAAGHRYELPAVSGQDQHQRFTTTTTTAAVPASSLAANYSL